MTNRKSHMNFRLVPNSVTLDDLERRNKLIALTAAYNFTEFENYVKIVEDTHILSAVEM